MGEGVDVDVGEGIDVGDGVDVGVAVAAGCGTGAVIATWTVDWPVLPRLSVATSVAL